MKLADHVTGSYARKSAQIIANRIIRALVFAALDRRLIPDGDYGDHRVARYQEGCACLL
ncbi:hypothetical protein Caci_3537 [Catenulispora acidiphila DSM 44928]|uniref:Transposase n=1 Tax=Catenulispora acidiphila (strain DSM 44928 / JCM 14897 / NBRC 102108 / NRRL B-24433 / ID139908) TaxID=479433 RepID=C7QAE3_CATAD|nr:hypothetical protein Caci_3537 [Catenulispora acidiphila DSM 44928]